MTLSDKLTQSPHVVARAVGEETVLLNLESGMYFGLDPVGGRIWALIGDGKTLAEACDVLVKEYDVTRDVLERDALKLASDLAEQKLVDVA
jgi:hypothetical protein